MTLVTPQLFGGRRYQVERRLGEGGSGVVYAAFDVAREMPVALKILRDRGAESLARFKREFRAVQGLAHPNLVALYELWEEDGWWFITMERVDGDDFLGHVAIARGRSAATAPMAAVDPEDPAPRFDEGRLRRALPQLAAGLVALHDAGVIHCDVKPSNVRVAADGRVVVLDFGIARQVASAPDERAAGTPAYMAPEQATGTAGREADWYAFGAMLYEALTGHLPYAGASGDVLFNKRHFAPPSPGELAPGVPADLAALCLDLLATEPGARPHGAEVLSRLAGEPVRRAVVPVATPALVGRDRELAWLADALDGSSQVGGAPRFVRITGESGIGKTALLSAFATRTDAAGRAWVVRGRCAQRELVPFRGFDGVLDDLAARLAGSGLPGEVDADLGAVLVQAFPVLRRVPAFAALAATDVHARRETASRVAAAVRWLLAQVAALRPLVIAIDDLQWADLDTITLLREVLEPALPGVLIAVVTRDRDEPALAGARELALAPLSLDDTADLVRQLIADPAIDDAAIAREARGHPWIATALARHAATRPGQRAVTLEHALRHSARQFGPIADRLLAAVCLAHAPIDVDTARRAVGQPDAALRDALALLRASQLVASTGVGAAERLEPYHDRIRQAVLASLVPDARVALHLAIASALEATPAADAEALALHWHEAGYPAAAANHALRAAEQAAGVLAFHRAARLYRWVVDLAPAGLDLRRIRVKHAEALAQAGLGVAAAEAFLACARNETGVAELRLRRLAMQQLLLMGHTDRALLLLDQLMRDLGLPNPTRPRRLLAALLARRLVVRLRSPRLRARSADDLSPIERARIDLTWDATAGLAMVDTLRSSYFQSLHLDLAFRAGDQRRLARALLSEVPYLASGGRRSPRLTRMLELADHVSVRDGMPWLPHVAHGITAFFHGGWRDAYDRITCAERLFAGARSRLVEDVFGLGHVRSMTRAMPVAALFFLGRIDLLAQKTPELLRDALARNDVTATSCLRTGTQVHLWLALGDVAVARHQADEGWRPWMGGTRFPNVMDLQARVALELYTDAGAPVHARVCAEGRDLARAHLLRSQYVRVTLLDARGRAALGAAMAPGSARAALLADARRCAARLAAERARWAVAMSVALRAGADLLAGDNAAGEQGRTAAAERFTAADMPLHAAAVRGDAPALAAMGVSDPARFARILFPAARSP